MEYGLKPEKVWNMKIHRKGNRKAHNLCDLIAAGR